MTISGHPVRDWTYRDARTRMVRLGRAKLLEHTGLPGLDDDGNRLVQCACGWRGNGIGWSRHLDTVVRAAISTDPRR